MEETTVGLEEYVRRVLDAYHQTPGTAGTVRRPDRLLAAQLHARGVPLGTVKTLLCWRRRDGIRPANAPPGVIRSLAYFSPVIDEVLASRVNPNITDTSV